MNIILYWRVPSKKNSKQWTWKFLISSKQYSQWEKEQLKYMESLNLEKITYPVTINYNFYRPDRRKTDMENKISSIQDMFVKAWLIEDDSWEFIPQMTSHSIEVDKTNPRVEIFITKYPYYES